MGRRTREKVLKVRFRQKGERTPKTQFFINGKSGSLKRTFNAGPIIGIGKVSEEEMYHTGSYNTLPQRLMKEFQEEEQRKSFGKDPSTQSAGA